MAYETDERLKSYLDTNQMHREQMCLAVLAIDRRFSNVRPRHPRRGPDGARDIEATLSGVQRVFGAVGFVNQANDSDEHKKKAGKKFVFVYQPERLVDSACREKSLDKKDRFGYCSVDETLWPSRAWRRV